MNRNIQTIMIVPMTAGSHDYPPRRTVDRRRLVRKPWKTSDLTFRKLKSVLAEMLAA